MLGRYTFRLIVVGSLIFNQACFSVFAQKGLDTLVHERWQQFRELQIQPGPIYFGMQKKDKWVGVTIKNNLSKPAVYYVRFHNPHLNEIEIYKNASAASFLLTGDWYPFYQRPFFFRDFLLPDTIPPNSTDSLLFRLNKRGESLSIEYELLPATQLLASVNKDYWWLGIIVSFVLLVSMVSLLMGFNFKEPLYFIFSVYSVLALAWLLNNTGVFFQFIWPDNILWHYKSRTFFSVASIIAYILFLYRFFENQVRKIDKWLFLSFIVFLLLKLVGVLIAPQVEYKLVRKYFFVLITGLGLAAFLAYLIYFFIRNFRGSRPHHFHLAAFLVYTLLIANETLIQFGISIFPFPGNSDYVPFVFFFLQLLLMAVGLSVQINQHISQNRMKELFLVRESERAYSSQQFEILESERNRIGRDIHDQLGGLLVSIKLNLSNLKLRFIDELLHRELDRMRIIVDSSINQLHQVVHDLVPPQITAENFQELVKERIRLYEEVSSIQFRAHFSLSNEIKQAYLVHLYRIICELISNSVQHSQCTLVTITCTFNLGKLTLSYRDNGIGFAIKHKLEGRGLRNIENRVSVIQGRIQYNTDSTGMSCHIEFELNQSHEANNISM